MYKFRKAIATCAIVGLVFGSVNAMAAVQRSCSLDGKKCVTSSTEWTTGDYGTLTQKCTSGSRHGTMAVIIGQKADGEAKVWLMYPAQKCAIGHSNTGKYNVGSFAQSHWGSKSYANKFGVRMYGNHCDNQKTGCYGTSKVVSSNR